jgi:hypothetical protein
MIKINKKLVLLYSSLFFMFSFCFTFAKTFKEVVFSFIDSVLSPLVPIIISLTIIYFVWAIIKFVIRGEVKDKEEAKQMMFWGIVGLFVMVSVWGLVSVVEETLGL